MRGRLDTGRKARHQLRHILQSLAHLGLIEKVHRIGLPAVGDIGLRKAVEFLPLQDLELVKMIKN